MTGVRLCSNSEYDENLNYKNVIGEFRVSGSPLCADVGVRWEPRWRA
jgi:hypothetical protein